MISLNPQAKSFYPGKKLAINNKNKNNNSLNPNAQPYSPSPLTLNYSHFLSPKSKHYLRIGTLNTCSWRSRIDEVTQLVATHSIDVLGVTETWLHPSMPSTLLLPTAEFIVVRRDHIGC